MASSWRVIKRANKSIATWNYELYQWINLCEWYVLRVIEPTLSSFRNAIADGHEFNGEREQAQSCARGMTYQTPTRNYY